MVSPRLYSPRMTLPRILIGSDTSLHGINTYTKWHFPALYQTIDSWLAWFHSKMRGKSTYLYQRREVSRWLEIWLCGEVLTRGAVKYSYNAGKCSCRGKTCGEVAHGETPSEIDFWHFPANLKFSKLQKPWIIWCDGSSLRATSPHVFPMHEHFPALYEYLTAPRVNTSPHSHISSHSDTSPRWYK